MSNPKISSLLNYEKIKDVIDIDALTDKKNMVKSYVITPSMEEHLAALIKNINESSHKAAQIIGGYGSGKSHLLIATTIGTFAALACLIDSTV